MKRYTQYEEAAKQYAEYFGAVPTINQMDDMYHKYRFVWKHFDGFTDWMINECISAE